MDEAHAAGSRQEKLTHGRGRASRRRCVHSILSANGEDSQPLGLSVFKSRASVDLVHDYLGFRATQQAIVFGGFIALGGMLFCGVLSRAIKSRARLINSWPSEIIAR